MTRSRLLRRIPNAKKLRDLQLRHRYKPKNVENSTIIRTEPRKLPRRTKYTFKWKKRSRKGLSLQGQIDASNLALQMAQRRKEMIEYSKEGDTHEHQEK